MGDNPATLKDVEDGRRERATQKSPQLSTHKTNHNSIYRTYSSYVRNVLHLVCIVHLYILNINLSAIFVYVSSHSYTRNKTCPIH